jgi:hypothetical protein
MKHRQVTSIDMISVISVPYWVWNQLGKDQVKSFAAVTPSAFIVIIDCPSSWSSALTTTRMGNGSGLTGRLHLLGTLFFA